jgi:hypothetical protein
MKDHFILDNILSGDELLWIYHQIIETPSWTLSRTSYGSGRNILPFMGFPGLNVETGGDIHNEFLAGYFRSILFRVKHVLKRDFSIKIPPEVLRIHVGAKSSFSKTEFHTDSDDTSHWTILGFLNPVWNAKDGGEFYLKDEKIEYKAGRFVVFPSSYKHDGGYVVNESLSYWRIAVNIILHQSTTDDSAAD